MNFLNSIVNKLRKNSNDYTLFELAEGVDIKNEIKRLRMSIDALGKDPLTDQLWSQSYLDWYGDEWGVAEDGIRDNFMDDLVKDKEIKLKRDVTESEVDMLWDKANDKTKEYIKKETRKRYHPEMKQLHDTMEKVLDLYDELENYYKG